jgi:hypothetical protein
MTRLNREPNSLLDYCTFSSDDQGKFPRDRQSDPDGWTKVSDTFRAPSRAAQVVMELGSAGLPVARLREFAAKWSAID